MKNALLVILCLISLNVFANPQSDLKKLFNSYFDYIYHKDEKGLQKILSKEYYQELKQSKTLDKIYKQYEINKPDPTQRSFDLVYKQGAMDKNLFFVNLKTNKQKEYDDYWYVVIKEKDKFTIKNVEKLED